MSNNVRSSAARSSSSSMVVCPHCAGHGKVLNPIFAYTAYSQDDMNEDPWFFAECQKGGEGIYGVRCPSCEGRNVVRAEAAPLIRIKMRSAARTEENRNIGIADY